MEDLKITPPDGYEIDVVNSTFDCIKFKPKKKIVTYADVQTKLFSTQEPIASYSLMENEMGYHLNGLLVKTEPQAEKLIALNKLMNTARVLNGVWKPRLDSQKAWVLTLEWLDDLVEECVVCRETDQSSGFVVYFQTENLAKRAIDILGEETIITALTNNY